MPFVCHQAVKNLVGVCLVLGEKGREMNRPLRCAGNGPALGKVIGDACVALRPGIPLRRTTFTAYDPLASKRIFDGHWPTTAGQHQPSYHEYGDAHASSPAQWR